LHLDKFSHKLTREEQPPFQKNPISVKPRSLSKKFKENLKTGFQKQYLGTLEAQISLLMGKRVVYTKMPWLQRTRLPCQDTDCVISNAQLIAQREAIEEYHHSLTAWGIKNTASIPWNKMGGRVNEAEGHKFN